MGFSPEQITIRKKDTQGLKGKCLNLKINKNTIQILSSIFQSSWLKPGVADMPSCSAINGGVIRKHPWFNLIP
jgi:hypothetical protein